MRTLRAGAACFDIAFGAGLVLETVRGLWIVLGFGTGCTATAFLLTAEFTFVLAILGLSFERHVTGRDPVAGSVYVLLLLLFTAMPSLMSDDELHG